MFFFFSQFDCRTQMWKKSEKCGEKDTVGEGNDKNENKSVCEVPPSPPTRTGGNFSI